MPHPTRYPRPAPAPRRRPGPRRLLTLVLLAALAGAGAPAGAQESQAEPLPGPATLRSWIEQMKASPKGPFARIRWFCADGTVHPPKPYPCAERGGGVQHGEWSERTQRLRAGDYIVGTVFAALDPAPFIGPDADLDALHQILVERFLVRADDGWIFRGARTYRGALQAEDEEAGARTLLLSMLGNAAWLEPPRYFLLREAVRLLPRQSDAASAERVRQLAIDVAEADPGFESLRAKIHNAPGPGDAAAVRAYAATRAPSPDAAPYEELAKAIDALYAEVTVPDALRALAERSGDPWLADPLRETAGRLEAAGDPAARLGIAGHALADLRDRLLFAGGPQARLALLEASLLLEDASYAAGNALLAGSSGASRRTRLEWLGDSAEALYGSGFFSRRELEAVRESLARVRASDPISVAAWREEVRYLARGPEWADRWFGFNFGEAVARFTRLEPRAPLYRQDRLRGSPLLVYGAVIDDLVRDANGAAGIQHELFGERTGAGLRALNPGLARGTLHAGAFDPAKIESLSRDGIYLLPETLSDLPPVAGILTRGEGSSLSHVQLLARNLGIPNVVVGESRIPAVEAHDGRRVVLAVSAGGVVQLDDDGPAWDAVLGAEHAAAAAEPADVVIRPDLKKLDLSVRRPVPLSELRSADSGRLSGPKGANLGQLRHYFGDAVPDGFVIPFGVFRKLLDQPLEPGGPAVWDWMRARYAAIAGLEGEAQQRAVREFLTRLRRWIAEAPWDPALESAVRDALHRHFGEDGSYGVFVRSDTNVEDLAGFTGAGLNLTLPNVVGEDDIFAAIRQVQASPFTERAFAWRQSHMEQPEYVFPAVVVQLAFPAEKSGVMVTADVDTGDPGWLSVAVNEGVGGAVEGQAAESLRIQRSTGAVRFLAQATAPLATRLAPDGGVEKVPASGTSAVLRPKEIDRLREFADQIPKRFPALVDDAGKPVPADVEFAFAGGHLALLQLRPFVQSKGAQHNLYLRGLDARLASAGSRELRLDDAPGTLPPAPPAEGEGAGDAAAGAR